MSVAPQATTKPTFLNEQTSVRVGSSPEREKTKQDAERKAAAKKGSVPSTPSRA